METRANYVLIGLAAVFGTLAAMAFALWITASELNRAYDEYVIVFEGPVRGLARGGEVRFQGIKVGEVIDLRIDPKDASSVLARVRIDASTPVRADSIGQLEPVGLTGVNLIQILDGRGAPLEPQMGQATPRFRGEGSEIDKILGAGAGIAERTSRALLAIQDLLTEENVERVSRILADLESFSSALDQQRAIVKNADEAVVALGAAGDDLERAAAAVAALSANADGQLKVLGPRTEEAIVAFTEASAAGRDALVELEAATAIVTEQSLPDFTTAVQDVRRLTEAVDRLSAQIERNPAQFVAGAERPVVEVRP